MSAVVVKLPETLNTKSGRVLGSKLKTRMTGDCPSVILDLSRVRTMDLGGAQELLGFVQELARLDGRLQIAAVSHEAATLLELMRIDKVLQKFQGFATEAPWFEMAPEFATEETAATSTVELPVAA